MIPGDLTAELARLLDSLALPAKAAAPTPHGTWRPAEGPGSYATSLPFALATLTNQPPDTIAARLADQLADLPWISTARATAGYLTVTVTRAHLAALPARIVAAGPACASSHALAGRRLTAPHPPDLATAPDWPPAWRAQRDALVGAFGNAAGADVQFIHSENSGPASRPAAARQSPPRVATSYYGADAVRYALARATKPTPSFIESQLRRPLDLSNPFFVVRYAHARAASILRWAQDLGAAPGRPAGSQPEVQPAELDLIDAMSWLPERVAAAQRTRRSAELTAHLEIVAQAWLVCCERHPALPFGGRAAPSDPSDRTATARLELAEAAMTILGAGLGLLNVAAPAKM